MSEDDGLSCRSLSLFANLEVGQIRCLSVSKPDFAF